MVEAPPLRLINGREKEVSNPISDYMHVAAPVTYLLSVNFSFVRSLITSSERKSIARRHWGVDQIAPIVVVININCIDACGGPPYPVPIHRGAT